MGDGDALRYPGGAGGEDDPGVVLGRRLLGGRGRVGDGQCGPLAVTQDAAGADDADDAGLAEDEGGAFLGVVGVDGDVGGAGGEDGEDRHGQVPAAGGDPDADPVAAADTVAGEVVGALVHEGEEGAVVERPLGGLEGEGVGVRLGGGGEHVEQGPGRCGPVTAVEFLLHVRRHAA